MRRTNREKSLELIQTFRLIIRMNSKKEWMAEKEHRGRRKKKKKKRNERRRKGRKTGGE
jgi:hypothetical protein